MIRAQTCPVCNKELEPNAAIDSPLFPFCSERCRLVDLYRWNSGQYAIVDELTPDRLTEDLLDRDESEAE
jgi:endogenous inhibitor of DNA gyrase (YacG/DUF329 family)